MPLVFGGFSTPRLDQKLNAMFAAESDGLTRTSRSVKPTRPSGPTYHQSVAGGAQARSDKPRPKPDGTRAVWLATTPSAPAPAAAMATAPYGSRLWTTAAGLSVIGTAGWAPPLAGTRV